MDASVAVYGEFYTGAQGDSVFHKLLAAAMGAGWPEGSEQYSYLERKALDWISSVLATVSHQEALRLVPVRGEVAHRGLVFRFYGQSFG